MPNLWSSSLRQIGERFSKTEFRTTVQHHRLLPETNTLYEAAQALHRLDTRIPLSRLADRRPCQSQRDL